MYTATTGWGENDVFNNDDAFGIGPIIEPYRTIDAANIDVDALFTHVDDLANRCDGDWEATVYPTTNIATSTLISCAGNDTHLFLNDTELRAIDNVWSKNVFETVWDEISLLTAEPQASLLAIEPEQATAWLYGSEGDGAFFWQRGFQGPSSNTTAMGSTETKDLFPLRKVTAEKVWAQVTKLATANQLNIDDLTRVAVEAKGELAEITVAAAEKQATTTLEIER